MRDVLNDIMKWWDAGETFGLATMVRTFRSAPREPGAALASVSNWTDRIRDRLTAAWHYVNLPRDSNFVYVAQRDGPDGTASWAC